MDSFARAQARHDNSEHPDFYRDDAAEERSDAELRNEARAQIESDHELLAQLLAEKLYAGEIKLLQSDDAIAFAARCNELLISAVEDYISTIVERVNEAISFGKHRDSTIGYMVQKAIGGGA